MLSDEIAGPWEGLMGLALLVNIGSRWKALNAAWIECLVIKGVMQSGECYRHRDRSASSSLFVL